VVLLAGLLLNSTLGWWRADASAALVIAVIAVREDINAWRGDVCCNLPHPGRTCGTRGRSVLRRVRGQQHHSHRLNQ
jgi:hypothetical protein